MKKENSDHTFTNTKCNECYVGSMTVILNQTHKCELQEMRQEYISRHQPGNMNILAGTGLGYRIWIDTMNIQSEDYDGKVPGCFL